MKKFLVALIAALALASCTNHGKKVKSGSIEMYYKDGITETEAQKSADLFNEALQATNKESSGRKSFQLTRPGDTIMLKMVVDQDKLGQVNDEAFYAIATMLSENVFDQKPVNLLMTDNKFKPFRTLAFKPASKEPGFGEPVTSGNIELFHDGVESGLAENLLNFLDNFIEGKNTISFQFTKDDAGTYLVKMAIQEDKMNDITDKDLDEICSKISSDVLNGSALVFQLTDTQFNSLKSYAYPQQ